MITEFFKVKDNAKVWPSTDPNDKPYYTYTCKLCGAVLTENYERAKQHLVINRHIETHYLRYKGVIE